MLQPPRAATDCHSVTWTFGRAWVETAPARPVEIAWVASGVVAKRCSANAAGSARPSPKRRRVPHLDDRRAADVQAHQRAAPDLVDDGVRQRQHDPLAGRRGGDRGGAAASRSRPTRAPARGGRRTAPVPSDGSSSGWPTSQRSSANAAGAIARAPASGCDGRGDDDQPAAQERRGRRSSRRRPATGPSAMSARRCSSASANDAAGAARDRDLQRLRRGR